MKLVWSLQRVCVSLLRARFPPPLLSSKEMGSRGHAWCRTSRIVILGCFGSIVSVGQEVLLDQPTCGAMQHDGSIKVVGPDSIETLGCATLVMTNCSAEEVARLCPAQCAFLEFSSFSSCGSACVAAEQCGAYRPAFPFPNSVTRTCEPCPSPGCARCAHDNSEPPVLRCTACRDGFTLSRDGLSCTYEPDQYMRTIYTIAGQLLVGIFIAAAILAVVCNRNWEALVKGLQHRDRCLPHMVETLASSGGQARYHSRTPLFPLNVNTHDQNIVGVGLALYYNQLVFVAIVAILGGLILFFTEDFLGVRHWSVLYCGYGSADEAAEAIIAYSQRRASVALFLWGTILPAAIVFARWQASAARTFDSVHTTMEDYTCALCGLPPDATDPIELQRWVESLLRKPIEGVSICYDFEDKEAEVRHLLDEHLIKREVEFAAALGVPLAGRPHRTTLPSVVENSDEDNASPEASARGEEVSGAAKLLSKLRCAGEAFVVMKEEEDVEVFFSLWEQPDKLERQSSFLTFLSSLPQRAHSLHEPPEHFRPVNSSLHAEIGTVPPAQRSFRGQPLTLREVTSEPTSIAWQHFVRQPAVGKRAAFGGLVFLAILVGFNLIVFFPLTEYVVRYARRAGQPPSALDTSFLGIIIAAGNSLISNFIWVVVPKLGFRRKDQADIVTFGLRSLLVLSNTLGLVFMTAQKLSASARPEENIFTGANGAVARSEELGREVQLANAVQNMFISGTFAFASLGFFSLYPLTLLQAILCIRTGLHGFAMTARECEKVLEPMEIWLPWDYAGHIQLVCCTFFPLFLAEPPGVCASRRLCAVLLLWFLVMYCAQRVIHLRASKETFFTTARLDTAVLASWALPVSQLALTAAYWLSRAQGFGDVPTALFCCATFVGSCGIYLLLLYQALRHQSHISLLYTQAKGEPYQAAQARLRYSYFNTNPIQVLMSDHLPELGLPRLTWYEAGKAYLQAADPRANARLEAERAVAEHAPEPQQEPRSFLQKLGYRFRVWFTGAPEHAYRTLDESMEHPGD